MSKKKCRIDIYEVDGKLAIFGDIPPDMEATIAGALASALLVQANTIMNTLLNETQSIEKIVHQ